MRKISYSLVIGSLNYAQMCMSLDIAYIVGILRIYLSNLRMDNWKAIKRVMRHLQRTKHYMIIYRRSDHLVIIGYSDFGFARFHDIRVYNMSRAPN